MRDGDILRMLSKRATQVDGEERCDGKEEKIMRSAKTNEVGKGVEKRSGGSKWAWSEQRTVCRTEDIKDEATSAHEEVTNRRVDKVNLGGCKLRENLGSTGRLRV